MNLRHKSRPSDTNAFGNSESCHQARQDRVSASKDLLMGFRTSLDLFARLTRLCGRFRRALIQPDGTRFDSEVE